MCVYVRSHSFLITSYVGDTRLFVSSISGTSNTQGGIGGGSSSPEASLIAEFRPMIKIHIFQYFKMVNH